NEKLAAVLIGAGVKIHTDKLVAHGADTVYVIDNPALKNRLVEPYMRALADLIAREKPSVVLAGATAWGRTLIPAVAAVLETGLTADCTGLRVNLKTGLLEQTRPTFGGNLMATIVCPERRPQMATVRPHVFEKDEPESARQGSVVQVKLDDGVFSSAAIFVEKHTELKQDERIEDAEVIVAGGRGLGKPDNLKLLNDLARILHGAVGATRPLVDEGWLPYVRQIGQTGKTVCPKLYIACGISGAVQHAAGMSTSDIVVAVNKDQSAPIFDIADYGLVGYCEEILPALIARLEQEEK
ncbi:MAG: electron transfer flavoprotein subunit alpha/FixB family protein, partial [Actinomycetota bacterium]